MERAQEENILCGEAVAKQKACGSRVVQDGHNLRMLRAAEGCGRISRKGVLRQLDLNMGVKSSARLLMQL